MSAILTEVVRSWGRSIMRTSSLSRRSCAYRTSLFYTEVVLFYHVTGYLFQDFLGIFLEFRPVRRRTMALVFFVCLVFLWVFRPVRRRTMAWYFYGSFALFAVEQWPVPQKNDGDQLHTTIAVEYNRCSSTEPFACLRVCSWSTVLRVCWLRTQ
jgi:hypothetical protein